MMIDVFEDKKGVKLADTLKSLPSQNLFVLDCICNLFDAEGEEKLLSIDQLMTEIRSYFHKFSLQRIDQKQLISVMDELQFYSLIELMK